MPRSRCRGAGSTRATATGSGAASTVGTYGPGSGRSPRRITAAWSGTARSCTASRSDENQHEGHDQPDQHESREHPEQECRLAEGEPLELDVLDLEPEAPPLSSLGRGEGLPANCSALLRHRLRIVGSAAGSEQQGGDGLGADCEIHDEVAVPQVPEVVGELLCRAGGVERVAAAELRPAGDAGLDQQAPRPEGDRALEQVYELRPFRPRADHRHLAPEHVPELGQLVEMRLAEKVPDPGNAGVVL